MNKPKLRRYSLKGVMKKSENVEKEIAHCDWKTNDHTDTTRPISWRIPEESFSYLPIRDRRDVNDGSIRSLECVLYFKREKMDNYTWLIVREAFGLPDETHQPKPSDKVWRNKVKFLVKTNEGLFLVRPGMMRYGANIREVEHDNAVLTVKYAYFRVETDVLTGGVHFEMEDHNPEV